MTKQRELFEQAPWEIDDAAEHLVATVVFPGPLEGEFDYLVPDPLRDGLAVGRRVKVPLGKGNRPVEGYCVRLETREVSGRRLKNLARVVDERNLLSPAMIRLTQWMSERYLCGWGQVLEAVVPAGVRGRAGTRMTRYVSLAVDVVGKVDQLDLPLKQARAMRILAESDDPMTEAELARAAGCTLGPIKSLRDKGLLTAQRRRTPPVPVDEERVAPIDNLQLNDDQRVALDAIRGALHEGKHQALLLHGVTGSGKTEVYIQAIQEVVRFGRQAIVLVPEISLTPQTVERFRQRFEHVAVLHSHLTDAERHWHWERIASGNVQVVVGARSAVFAPTRHLGLLIMDEEHETSFKQESTPRYHARDVALKRAEMENIPLVLGSATPSLESWQRAETGEYRRLSLPGRVFERALPAVSTIDLRNEVREKAFRGALSRVLCLQMEQALKAGEQVILLLNRRGYSTHIQCPSCGYVARCEHCDIALTYHRQDHLMLCHYCDEQAVAPVNCPECGYQGIRYAGFGTQKLEAEVKRRFADYPCLRMDTDTMHAPGSHGRALAAFREGKAKILLGTQMIAKGLDFPNVTLVGVVNADLALHLPDFRAAERTFQLLAQVAGRAGRGDKGGRVFVQTFTPEHPAIQAAVRHDYEMFAAEELPLRKALKYPPFSSMIRMVIRGPQEQRTAEFGQILAQEISAGLEARQVRARLLGPAPAPIARLRDKFRFNLQLQGEDLSGLREAVRGAKNNVKPPGDVEWIADVDPYSML